MPIEAPTRSPSITGSKTVSEFILCEDFVFRPATVDGFLHRTYEDGSAVTIVNFKSFTQNVPDPERRLFNFLLGKLHPHSPDEAA